MSCVEAMTTERTMPSEKNSPHAEVSTHDNTM
jgi:hypothetical protein